MTAPTQHSELPFYNNWKESILAKAKFYGFPSEIVEKLSIKSVFDILEAHETEQLALDKKTYGSYTTNLAEATNDNYLGEYEIELLATANKYKIPYNPNKINWIELIDTIDEYESLIKKAIEYGINWRLSTFDPIGLEQEIEEAEFRDIAERQSLHRYYHSTRL
jgi:hypothetical protein